MHIRPGYHLSEQFAANKLRDAKTFFEKQQWLLSNWIHFTSILRAPEEQSKCNTHVLCCSLLLLTAAVHCCSRTVLLTATAHYCFPMLLFTTAHVLLLLTATAPRAGEPRSTNGINLTKNSPGPRVPSTSSCTKGNPFLHHSYFRSTSDRLNTTDNQPQLSNKNAEERLTIFCFIYTIRRTGFPPKDVCQIVSRNKSKTWGAWGK